MNLSLPLYNGPSNTQRPSTTPSYPITGISEPLPVAETFTFEMEEGQGLSLSDVAEIDSMVTVVDAVNFMKDMRDAEDLASRGLEAGE